MINLVDCIMNYLSNRYKEKAMFSPMQSFYHWQIDLDSRTKIMNGYECTVL